jgi:tetratricopeptide (TPR) repeat protein
MGEESDIFYAIDDYIKHAGEKVKPALIVAYMTKAKEMYQAKKLSDEEVLKIYSDLSPILEKIISVNPSEENLSARQGFENAFITSGVATCDNLVTVFTPRFEANPTDIATVKQIAIILTKNECVNTDLFLKAVTAQHQLEPSYNSAYGLYKLNGAKGNNEVAMQYLQEAIDNPESDDLKDGELLLEMATFMFKNMEANAKAFQLSKMAAEKNPAVAGKAYFLAASIWANQNCGGDDIDKRAKYWVAVDYLTKAKNADATLAEEADNLIRGYRQYFPKTEDAFMYNLVDGNPYTISCGGLSASTTVRTTK